MGCCNDVKFKKGWGKAIAQEGLCFRFVQAKTLTYINEGDIAVPTGDYIVKCPSLELTFKVSAADFDKFFDPLLQEQG